MYSITAITTALGLFLCGTSIAYAQAGVCNRAFDDTAAKVRDDTAEWEKAFNATDLPPKVKQAHIVLFEYNRDETIKAYDSKRQQCTASFEPYQKIVDNLVSIYTLGLSDILQPHMTHVDVSELLAGYPLGGPNALVPKFREQILSGDNGTVANILRDPWKCLTFQRKC